MQIRTRLPDVAASPTREPESDAECRLCGPQSVLRVTASLRGPAHTRTVHATTTDDSGSGPMTNDAGKRVVEIRSAKRHEHCGDLAVCLVGEHLDNFQRL